MCMDFSKTALLQRYPLPPVPDLGGGDPGVHLFARVLRNYKGFYMRSHLLITRRIRAFR